MVSVRSGVGRRRPVAHLGGTRVSRAEHLPLPRGANLRDVDRAGGTDVAVSGRKPSSTVASVSYNLPDTVLELFRSREHLLGERARVSRYPVVARRLRHLPAHPRPPPPPSDDALTARFPRIRRRRRARARLLGHLAARQARVRALRLVRSDERANPTRGGSTGPPRSRRGPSSTSPWSSCARSRCGRLFTRTSRG